MTRQEIGAFIQQERERQGLTWYALAKIAKVSIAQLQTIEQNTVGYNIDSVLRIMEALDSEIIAGRK